MKTETAKTANIQRVERLVALELRTMLVRLALLKKDYESGEVRPAAMRRRYASMSDRMEVLISRYFYNFVKPYGTLNVIAVEQLTLTIEEEYYNLLSEYSTLSWYFEGGPMQ